MKHVQTINTSYNRRRRLYKSYVFTKRFRGPITVQRRGDPWRVFELRLRSLSATKGSVAVGLSHQLSAVLSDSLLVMPLHAALCLAFQSAF